MSTRIFISYRSSDGADKATALARDLDTLFGQAQVFLDKEDLPAGCRWRDEIVRTLSDAPILLVLVTPNYLGARDGAGQRCIDRADDPVRDELATAVAANAHVIPLMCDGVTETPAASSLPAPFDQLAERTWRHLRAYDWREDLARLADDLRALGIVDRAAPAAPVTAPSMLLPEAGGAGKASTGRRLALGALVAVVLGGGFAAWRWQESRPPSLAGRWRVSVGKRGATSSRDGEVVMVTFQQAGDSLKVASSAVDIERDPDWQNYRDFWQKAKGQPLTRVFYRGEGAIQDEGSDVADAPPGPRRILLKVHVDPPEGGDAIDTGALRGAIDPDGNRIRARLWLDSERGERVVDLRREP
jgi:hypothetical protein